MKEHKIIQEQQVNEMINKLKGLQTVSQEPIDEIIFHLSILKEDMKKRKQNEENSYHYQQQQQDEVLQNYNKAMQTAEQSLQLLKMKYQIHFMKKKQLNQEVLNNLLKVNEYQQQMLQINPSTNNNNKLKELYTMVSSQFDDNFKLYNELMYINLISDSKVEEFVLEEMQAYKNLKIQELELPESTLIQIKLYKNIIDIDKKFKAFFQKISSYSQQTINDQWNIYVIERANYWEQLNIVITAMQNTQSELESFISLYKDLINEKSQEIIFFQNQINLHQLVIKKDNSIHEQLNTLIDHELIILEESRQKLLNQLDSEKRQQVELSSSFISLDYQEILSPPEENNKPELNYMSQKVNPLFERLIVDLLITLPDDIIGFAVNWLQTKGANFLKGGKVSREEKNAQKPDANKKEDKKNDSKKKKQKGSDSEESEDEEYDPSYDLEIQKKKEKLLNAGQRNSVSSEVYGMFNKKEDFKAKVVPKTQDQMVRIQSRMDQAFMFSVLDEKEKNIVIGAMEECKFKTGDWVIRQGEAGDVLYVIDEGDLDCFKKFTVDGNNTYLKTYHPGEAFGELALLYNAPRAASIQAKTNCLLWSLDRECFNIIVKDAARKKREQYEEVIKKVKLFEALDPYEATRLGDGIQDINFKAGQTIYKQGDPVDNFYVVASGQVTLQRAMKAGQTAVQIDELNIGDYFGELGLIHNLPRQMTAIAKGDVKLIYLNQDKFNRLLSPIFEVIIKNESKYGNNWSLDSANK